LKLIAAMTCLTVLCASAAIAQNDATDTRAGIAPDIREDETQLKLQRGDFVAVPIPISNPTLGTGLVAGAAYFYPQSEAQKKLQPASVTGLGAMYTSNESKAIALVQQNYWRDDKWRFTGGAGAADLKLSLLTADESNGEQNLDWRIEGTFFYAKLARRLKGDWYGGALTRLVDADQSIESSAASKTSSNSDFDDAGKVRSVGVGVYVEYDQRDNPLNSSAGRYFKLDALFNDEAIGSNDTYQSFASVFKSYHRQSESLVVAWEAQACGRSGTTPLWDACMVKLRGFSATDYLGTVSASAQAEARWELSDRWGVVGFAGVGYVGSSFSGIRDNEPIPSYGVGLRLMVLKAKRINLRVDFARSTDSNAIHVSVGEAF
jgi:outer membrane protein assembly factor BamA